MSAGAQDEGRSGVDPLLARELVRACMAADACLHEPADHPQHEAHRRAVCDLLSEAIGAALKAGV